MGFLIRRPFSYITVGAVIIVVAFLLFTYTGILRVAPSTVSISSAGLSPETTTEGQEAILTFKISNYADKSRRVEFKIRADSPKVKFYYYENNSLIMEPVRLGGNYTTTYPLLKYMAQGEDWGLRLLVKATLDPGDLSYKYRIRLEIYADATLTDSKTVQLEVKSAK